MDRMDSGEVGVQVNSVVVAQVEEEAIVVVAAEGEGAVAGRRGMNGNG